MSEIRYNVTHPESDNEDKNKKGGRSVISGNRYTASVGTEFVNIAGSKEQLSCRLKRNGYRGWVGLPEDYPLGYGEKTQAILEAFAERIRCPEASRSS